MASPDVSSPGAASSDAAESGRLIAFCDAVVAIAMTLLALELPVPEGTTTGELWDSFRHDSRYFLAFFISFAVIAAMWSSHHQIFRFVERTDARLRNLSLAWLLTVVLIPFAAKLLTVTREGQEGSAHALLFTLYAVVQCISSGIFLLMVHQVSRAGLWAADAPAGLRRRVDRRTVALIAGFLLSIPLLFVTSYAWVLWIVVPPVSGRVIRRIEGGVTAHRSRLGR